MICEPSKAKYTGPASEKGKSATETAEELAGIVSALVTGAIFVLAFITFMC